MLDVGDNKFSHVLHFLGFPYPYCHLLDHFASRRRSLVSVCFAHLFFPPVSIQTYKTRVAEFVIFIQPRKNIVCSCAYRQEISDREAEAHCDGLHEDGRRHPLVASSHRGLAESTHIVVRHFRLRPSQRECCPRNSWEPSLVAGDGGGDEDRSWTPSSVRSSPRLGECSLGRVPGPPPC